MARGGIVDLGKTLEQQRQFVRRDANPRVLHRELKSLAIERRDCQVHGAASRRELNGIAHQVEKNLLEVLGVQKHRTQRGIDAAGQGAAFACGHHGGVLGQNTHHLVQVNGCWTQLKLARFGLGKIEDVVHPVHQAQGVALGAVDLHMPVRWRGSRRRELLQGGENEGQGVRNSWLTVATKSLFAWLAVSAWLRA